MLKYIIFSLLIVYSICWIPTLSSHLPVNKDNSLKGLSDCKEYYFTQYLDHYNWQNSNTTYQQRYFVCDKYWRKNGTSKGPIFFYPGNEADVELYINNTGLMWENADAFGALLLFAEHRYYGDSRPFPGQSYKKNLQYLSSEQALADYAHLLTIVLGNLNASTEPVIAFGGSYGGMLASWMRIKYPHIISGCIAGSAPILAFYGQSIPYDQYSYPRVVTQDASSAGGCSDMCANNIRNAFKRILVLGETQEGRELIRDSMAICTALNSMNDIWSVAFWGQSAYAFLAMGDFPYPSPYILNGNGILPAWPMRVMCDQISSNYTTDRELLTALRFAIGVYANYTKKEPCFNMTSGANNATIEVGYLWGWQACTEMVMPMGTNGQTDMFWNAPYNYEAFARNCVQTYGVHPRKLWAHENYGGRHIQGASNMVFSNGLLDPWHTGGVLWNVSDSVTAVVMADAAHHLDLMFSNPLDPPSVIEGRKVEVASMWKWVNEHYAKLSR